jgi:zinc transporter, ZIP family
VDYQLILTGVGASLAAGLLTGAGALPVFVVRRISAGLQDAMLGFAAGVMMAASVFSLIVPALEAAQRDHGSAVIGALVVVAGVLLGGLALWVVNERVPHEHFILGREGPPGEGLRRIWLFVIAITLHNFPEGLAVGVAFGSGELGSATALAIGIGLQNIPEGLAVAVALLTLGYSRAEAVAVATATGLVEPVGGLIGVVAVTLVAPLLPWGLAFAAGAMIFVISDEIIPETHRHNHQNQATGGLMVGFVLMMFLDVVLG